MTHTPGPWTIGRLPKTILGEAASIWRGECKTEHIADISWSVKSVDEHCGNARLIAAAPKLLSTLEAIDRRLARTDGFDGIKEIIREAIDLATGETE